MKNYILIFCFCISGIVIYAQDSSVYELEFKNGYKETVIFDNTKIDSCFKNYLSFDFINLGLFFGHQEPAPIGTIATNIDYNFYPGDNNRYFYGNLYVPILDGARMEPNVDELKTVRVYLDAGYSKAFAGKTKKDEKTLSFYNPDQQAAGYDYTIHRATLPIYYQSKWMYRFGLGLHQRGVNYAAEDDHITIDSVTYAVGSERSLILQAGISKSKYYRINYTSEGFGSQQSAVINHMYFDLLLAPVILLTGEATTDEGAVETGSFSELNELDRHFIGWRFGIKYAGSSIRAKNRGTSAGIEFGSMPGLASGGGYFLLKYGMQFYWK